jgi:hypothetical protein
MKRLGSFKLVFISLFIIINFYFSDFCLAQLKEGQLKEAQLKEARCEGEPTNFLNDTKNLDIESAKMYNQALIEINDLIHNCNEDCAKKKDNIEIKLLKIGSDNLRKIATFDTRVRQCSEIRSNPEAIKSLTEIMIRIEKIYDNMLLKLRS